MLMNFTDLPRKMIRTGLVLVLAALLTSWGTFAPAAEAPPTANYLIAQAADDDVGDPLEPFNRVIFSINDFLLRLLIRPIAEIYTLLVPDFMRDGVRNVLNNLRTPVVLANDLLQWEGQRALDTTKRFFINSTIGLGGIIDVAEQWGIKGHDEDFGQTLAVWGVGEGFYLVLPILGPSNPRDGIGKLADFYLDPLSQWAANTDREEINYTRTVVRGIDSYSRVMDDLEKLRETSIDFYATVRSISRQKRQTEILNGQPAEGAPLPDINYDFNAQVPEIK